MLHLSACNVDLIYDNWTKYVNRSCIAHSLSFNMFNIDVCHKVYERIKMYSYWDEH